MNNMTAAQLRDRFRVYTEISDERRRQVEKWGVQRHPSGTGGPEALFVASTLKRLCQSSGLPGGAGDTWLKILAEEVGEAAEATDRESLRDELIQILAVTVAWVETLDAEGVLGA